MKKIIGVLLMCQACQAFAGASADEANALILKIQGLVTADRAFVKTNDGAIAEGIGLLIPCAELFGESRALTATGRAALAEVESFARSSDMAYTVFVPEGDDRRQVTTEAAPRGKVRSTSLMERHVYITIRN